MINDAKKKIANNNTLHCIEPVRAIRMPKTNVPRTIAIFSVTS